MKVRIAPLGEYVEIVMGQAPPGSACNKEGKGTPFVKAGEFSDDGPLIREWTTKPLKMARHKDVLVCVVGATAGKINRGADCAIGRSVAAVRPDESELDSAYLRRFLECKVLHLRGKSQGLAQGVVTRDMIESLEIPLPPLDEQKRIAAILDKADQLRQKRRQTIALLDSLTQSIFLEMFGDLVEKEKRSSSSLTVADVGRVQLGRQRAPKYQTGKFTRPYVRVANVYEDRIDLSDVLSMDFDDRDFRDYKLESGDILLNEGQSTELVGRPAIWRNEIPDCCFQNTLVRFQSDTTKLLPEFALAVFLHYFRTGEFAKISSKTSSVAHLGASRFSRMPFPLPPIGEQTCFTERARRVRKVKAVSALGDADTLFSSLQHRAFSGNL